MTKTQVQRNREHIARIRRKARAFDNLMPELKKATLALWPGASRDRVEQVIERAEKQAGE